MLRRVINRVTGPKKKEYFTIMIMPGPNSKVRKISIPRVAIRNTALAILAVFLVSAVMLGEYLHMKGEVWELDSLRVETKEHRHQLEIFASSIVDMKSEMSRLKEMDSKLRKLANLKVREKKQQTLGIGGSKELSELTLSELGDKSHSELMEQMKQEFEDLKLEASAQENSMQKLTEYFEHRNSVLAATPSIWPVRGFVTSNFGYRKSPVYNTRQFHEGLDIANKTGTPIVATADGTVSETGYQSGYGRFVKIQHGYGYVTLYGHMSKTAVKRGQHVKRGETIGYLGNTGRSTGPHVHYEVRLNGAPTNPRNYL